MDKKVFIEYIDKIKDYTLKERAIDTALRALSPDFGGFSYSDILDDMVKLLKQCVGDKYDNLDYYIWEYDFGESALADSVTNEDGTPIPFRTPEDVYNLIMDEYADDEKENDKLIDYLVSEVKKYKKLYENEKDHSETLQKIVDKTMDAIVDDVIPEAIKEIKKKTTVGDNTLTLDDLLKTITDEILKEFGKDE